MTDVGPGGFLRRHAGTPRGFWAHGDRWIAHAGVLTEVRSDGGPGRFAEVRQAADALLGEGSYGPFDGRVGRRRLYGGFAFRDDHAQVGEWRAFPAALFHLPRLELVGDADGSVELRLHALLSDEPADALEERLHRDLVRTAGRLESASGWDVHAPVADPLLGSEETAGTGPEAWRRAVGEILEAIRGGTVSKVVLARTLDLVPAGSPDPASVALALWRQSRGTHAFLFEPEPGHAIVGAAPETVATLDGGRFHATAVAGSIRRGETNEEQRRNARSLLASTKDREEQRVVVEDMERRLRPLASEVRVQDEPHVLTLARIQHLETEIRARVGEGLHVIELLEALHPTPAVCGLPRDAALRLLRSAEPFDRGWYAGPVGWLDGGGDGVFVPALRTASVHDGRWRLYAGAGIVEGSEAAAEWEETAIKFEPVVQALASVSPEGREEGESR